MDPNLEKINNSVAEARKALRQRQAWDSLWKTAFPACSIPALAILLHKLLPVPAEIIPIGVIVTILVMLAATIFGYSRKVTDAQAARFLDARVGSRERFATVLELQKTSSPWMQQLLHDAAQIADGIKKSTIWNPVLPRLAKLIVLTLAVAAGLAFVPEYRSKGWMEKSRQKENIKDTGEQIAQFAKRTLENRAPVLPTTREALQNIAELGTNMASLTQADALKEVGAVKNEIEEKLKELQKTPALQPLRNDGPEHGNQFREEAVQKRLQEMESKVGKNTPEGIEDLRSNLQDLRNQANKGGEPSTGEKGQVGAGLESLAKKAAEMGVSQEAINQAMEMFKQGKFDQMVAKMDAALRDLEEAKKMAEAMKQLQQRAGASGKDLAEQIENGEGDAARQRLAEMMKKLSNGSASSEEMAKMLQEVAKAAQASKEYQKLAEHLQKATQSMQGNNSQSAMQQLAEAKKEIENLMQQSSEMQALMDNLEALNRAQMAVSSGRSWGECKNPGFGKGGKPGKGVGTWTEETGWQQYPEMSELWDNSGINRPDMDGKGLTDRGNPTLAENLDATKLKGQLNPGSAMPSVSIKGLSIKGQSSVQYQEALSAAQQEAQAALNQDQVPRAYQGAVKNYFDDLKK